MRPIAAILTAALLLAYAPSADAAEPTAVHPAKVSMKGWQSGIGGVNPIRLDNRFFAEWLKGSTDIPKNEILVLRIACGPQLDVGTNLLLALWNKDTNLPAAGSEGLLLAIEAASPAQRSGGPSSRRSSIWLPAARANSA